MLTFEHARRAAKVARFYGVHRPGVVLTADQLQGPDEKQMHVARRKKSVQTRKCASAERSISARYDETSGRVTFTVKKRER